MIKKTCYNIQLLSSYLLNKTHFLFLFIFVLLNGNNIFSLVFCDEIIDNLAENEISQEKKNNNNLYLYSTIALVAIGVIIIIYYYSGGDGKDPGSLFSIFSKKTQNLPLDHLYGHKAQSIELKALSYKLEHTTANLESISRTQATLRMEHVQLQKHCELVQNNQDASYKFLEDLMSTHPGAYYEIEEFFEKHPLIPSRRF